MKSFRQWLDHKGLLIEKDEKALWARVEAKLAEINFLNGSMELPGKHPKKSKKHVKKS